MAYDLEQLNILLIEDDASMRALIRDMLYAFGISNIQTAQEGSKAYAELRHFPADIVLTDWVMEPLDGIDFTRMVRTAPDSPNPFVPIIMLTAHSSMERVIQARDSGVNEFLAKPVTAKGLYSRIATVIESPRQFVRASEYFGPDRRRSVKEFMGMDRRSDGGDDDA
ncbi:MAG: response regulator [Rhodospirillaceae bacterium]|nr:response regulator [Rhodospirillaceae bacterium]MDD9916385.1 response regulator [Rhodospirillaceae bacterium]MDD9927751.1 response regulator [Rhodospirillaceae bacterium]